MEHGEKKKYAAPFGILIFEFICEIVVAYSVTAELAWSINFAQLEVMFRVFGYVIHSDKCALK